MPTPPHEHRLLVFRTATRPKDLADEYRKAFEDTADTIDLALVHYLTTFNNTMTSNRLTRNGAQDEVRTLSLGQLKEVVTKHTSTRAKLTEQIDGALTAALKRTAAPEDATLRYLRHRDIVDFYNTQDPLQHRVILDDAIREKDLDFVEALASAPRYRRKFDPTLVMSARQQLAEASDPVIAKLTALRQAYDVLYQNAATVIRETAAQAGLAQLVPEPVAQ